MVSRSPVVAYPSHRDGDPGPRSGPNQLPRLPAAILRRRFFGRLYLQSHSQTYWQTSAPLARHWVSVTRTFDPPHISMALRCQPTTVGQSCLEKVALSHVVSCAFVSPSLSYVRRPVS